MAAFPTIIVLVQDGGEGLGEWVAQVKSWDFPWVVACGPEQASELRREWGEYRVVSPAWPQESRSLIAAAVLARPQSTGWLVLPSALLCVQATTLRQLGEALENFPLVYPLYNGLSGEPVGWGAEFFSELIALPNDDVALRRLLARYAGYGVEVADPCVLQPCHESEMSASAPPHKRFQVFDAYQGK